MFDKVLSMSKLTMGKAMPLRARALENIPFANGEIKLTKVFYIIF